MPAVISGRDFTLDVTQESPGRGPSLLISLIDAATGDMTPRGDVTQESLGLWPGLLIRLRSLAPTRFAARYP